MKVLVRQVDGLGNQLFQYAAGIYFAHRHHATLEILQAPDEIAHSVGHPRPFLLSRFSLSTKVRERTSWDRLVCAEDGYKRPVASLARLLSRTQVYRQSLQEAWCFKQGLDVSQFTRAYYVEGYFQAHQFARAVEEQLRRELTLLEGPAGQNLVTLEAIANSECAVSLHLRRGDYTTLNGGKLALPLTYYQNAIRTIRERFQGAQFFVFSDDIPFARASFADEEGMVYVDHNDQANAHEDLRLMSSCRHHIIANSTLSWWGAWLNAKADKLVVAPDRWLDPAVPPIDLLPPTWMRVATEAG